MLGRGRRWCSLAPKNDSLRLWRQTVKDRKLTIVGDFCESLVRRLLDLKGGGDSGTYVDAIHPGNNIGFEIKGSDSGHSWRLGLDQIDGHLEIASGFPFTDLVYCLIGYNNARIRCGKTERKITALSRHRDQSSIRSFVAQNLAVMYILDGRLIEILKQKRKIRPGLLPCQPGRLFVELSRSGLDDLANGKQQETMKALGMSRRFWQIEQRKIDINFASDSLVPVEIDVVSVLRTRLRRCWCPPVLRDVS